MLRVNSPLRSLAKRQFAAHIPRFALWSPVGLMLGAGAYLSLPYEPSVYAGATALLVTSILLMAARRYALRGWVLPFFLIALGFSAAQLRAHMVATPLLTHEMQFIGVEGTVDEIEPVENKEKIVLSHLNIENLPESDTPRRVRVSFRGSDSDIHVGDRVRLQASLYPLPAPIMPGSFDFARHFYFRGIGGNGFAMRPPEVIASHNDAGWRVWLYNLRHAIGEDMRAHMSGAVGTVAAAMTVGETGPIPADIKNVLRDSGLAHMLAIAGLHLGIVTGILFFNIRLLLSLYPPWALRLPVKKIAAVFALTGAWIYLLLAGCPIPAQRAFIMVAFLFTAVLLDRRGVTLRTLSIAALIILLLFPEAMLGASFQMSFAATLAIIALYERFGRTLSRAGTSWWRRAGHHGLGIVVTSLVATLATAPFVLYHFNRFALFGLIANMIVVPLATFVIMPGMVLALILMPFGLQAIGYAPMAFGTDIMIRMAQWVTSLPNASLHLPSPTDTGLALASFGLLWLCLMVGRVRLLGITFIAAGLLTIRQHIPVDVLVSDDARQVMVRLPDGHYTTLKGTARSFTVQNWLRSEGEDELVPVKEIDIDCDKMRCHYQLNGRSLTMVRKASDDDVLNEACAQKMDVLVAWRYLHRENCTGPALLIGRAELEAYGAQALWLRTDGVRVAHTRETGRGRRIWEPLRTQEPEEME